jgi:hypothetical protein
MGRGPGTRNPYTPDSGAQPPALTGREVELEHFRETVTQVSLDGTEKHLLMTGLRGVGKTVLLNVFEEICAENGWHGEANEVSEKTALGPFIARETRRALLAMSALKRAGDAAKRALRVVKGFSLSVGEATLEFDVDAIPGKADSGDLATDLRDLFVEVGVAAEACDAAFALILDEVHNVQRSEFEALIIGLHRAKQKNLPIAFVGAGLPLPPELTREAKTYAERMFRFRKVGPLDRDDAAAALIEPAEEQGVSWQQAAVDEVVRLTEGYPYFIQEYGRHVWRLGTSTTITRKQVDDVVPVVQAFLDDSFFEQRVAGANRQQLLYMSALASLGDESQRSGDVAKAMGRSVQAASKIRDALMRQSRVYSPEYGYVAFTVPQCADYLRRHHPMDKLLRQ